MWLVLLALPPFVLRPEPPSTAAVYKQDARRWHTPISSPPARQPAKRSVALNAFNGKAGLPVPAFQPQSLYPSPTSPVARIPRDPCSSAPLLLPVLLNDASKLLVEQQPRLRSAAKLVIKAKRERVRMRSFVSHAFFPVWRTTIPQLHSSSTPATAFLQ